MIIRLVYYQNITSSFKRIITYHRFTMYDLILWWNGSISVWIFIQYLIDINCIIIDINYNNSWATPTTSKNNSNSHSASRELNTVVEKWHVNQCHSKFKNNIKTFFYCIEYFSVSVLIFLDIFHTVVKFRMRTVSFSDIPIFPMTVMTSCDKSWLEQEKLEGNEKMKLMSTNNKP